MHQSVCRERSLRVFRRAFGQERHLTFVVPRIVLLSFLELWCSKLVEYTIYDCEDLHIRLRFGFMLLGHVTVISQLQLYNNFLLHFTQLVDAAMTSYFSESRCIGPVLQWL